MHIEYIKYDENLLKDLEINSSTIYVFSDYLFKKKMKKENLKFLEEYPICLTFDEFKKEVYKTDKIILTDSKRFIHLYNCLKKEFDELNIKSYFDSIEFSTKFYNFFYELNINLCDEINELEVWQKEYFDKFYNFKTKFLKYLNKNNFIPKEWVEQKLNLDISTLDKYNSIVFIDIVEFTPLDKYLISELNKKMDIKIRVQIEENDFDEEKLEIKNITLPKTQNTNISILEVSDKLELVGNLMLEIENKKSAFNIFSPEADENEFHKYFPNNFINTNSNLINQTKFFKFLLSQKKLLDSVEIKYRKSIPINIFMEEVLNLEMREYYNLNSSDINYLYEKLDFGNKYIRNEKNEKINKIYSDIIFIYSIKNIDEMTAYFIELLSNELFQEIKYMNMCDKVQEYLHYSKTILKTMAEKDFYKCFKNGKELLNYLLSTLNDVVLTVENSTQDKHIIKPISNSKSNTAEDSVFINMSTGFLTIKKDDDLLLTENQKLINGMKPSLQIFNEKKYRLYQAILTKKNVDMIYIKNEVTGENISPLLFDFLNEYKIEEKIKKISSTNVLENLISSENKDVNIFPETMLPKKTKDFKNNVLKFGVYSYNEMRNCEYKFFFNNIAKIYPLINEEDVGISLKVLGIYAHELFENIMKYNKMKIIENNDYKLNIEEATKISNELFEKNKDKFKISLHNYFTEILNPRLVNNCHKFFEIINKKLSNKTVTTIETEIKGEKKIFKKDDLEIILNGRIDLVINTLKENYIIDVKTGDKTDIQLDFYSILLFGDENLSNKAIYNVFDGKYTESEKTKLSVEKIDEEIEKFLDNNFYQISNKISSCQNCAYTDICRKLK